MIKIVRNGFLNLKQNKIKFFIHKTAVVLFFFLIISFKSSNIRSSFETLSLEFKLKYGDSLFNIGRIKESLLIYNSLENKLNLSTDRELIYKIATIYAMLDKKKKLFHA